MYAYYEGMDDVKKKRKAEIAEGTAEEPKVQAEVPE